MSDLLEEYRKMFQTDMKAINEREDIAVQLLAKERALRAANRKMEELYMNGGSRVTELFVLGEDE